MSAFFTRKQKYLHNTDPEKRIVRTILFSALGAVMLMVLIASITFVLTVKSKELTMVPDTRGMELENAMLKLQDKALYARIQLRYSDSMKDKGVVLGQSPRPGTLVKAGARVLLKVSKGVAIEKLDNYVGMDITTVENHLKNLTTNYGQLLTVKKPYDYINSVKPAGTILEQKPRPGSEIAADTSLEFIISKGPVGQLTPVRDLENVSWNRALDLVILDGYPFSFSIVKKKRSEPAGVVVNQSPSAGSEVPSDTVRQLFITAPADIPKDQVFGVLQKEIPQYPVPVPITVTAVLPAGDKKIIADFKYTGGLISIPYLEPDSTSLVIAINGEDKIREIVRVPSPK